MPPAEHATKLREKLLEHLEAALAITDELNTSIAGYMIESALDEIRASHWPGNLDVPPKP